MLTKRMQEEINKQINAELYSSYLYLAMSAYCESLGLKGFANWTRVQAQEELTHAMKFYDYMASRGGRIILHKIEEPGVSWESPKEVFEKILDHEKLVTSLINNLVNVAIEERDHATNSILQWFVDEQVEEESSADAILSKIKLAGGEGSALFMIDQELAQRVFVPPVQVAR